MDVILNNPPTKESAPTPMPDIGAFTDTPNETVQGELHPYRGISPTAPLSESSRPAKTDLSVPSERFVSLACASIGAALLLRVIGRSQDAQFVGQWAPTLLAFGMYRKLMKLEARPVQRA
ncbi:MAG: hypothetical protein J0M12_11315 [Deltaproteobacteria bacterium]|nr:hypothetical protein [Deltaproteobacteria bacterium]